MELYDDLRKFVISNQLELSGLPLSTKPSEITEIEICLEDLNSMQGVKPFKNLKSLYLCNTSLSTIEGLSSLYSLEELYLSENQIQTIENLESQSNLRRLNLSSNKIQTLENLDFLVSLEWFWINENLITRVENLENLRNLKEFSIARNKISEISNCLIQSASIEVLNLSANPITSFQEVKRLALMKSLSDLSLADPNYGESTICSLTNYSVFVLFMLKKLKVLDQIQITSELRNSSENTFLKKKLFYTMKVKSVKRAVAALVKSITEEAYLKMQENWKFILSKLIKTKEIEIEIDERLSNSFSSFSPFLFLLKTGQESLENPLDSVPDLQNFLNSCHSKSIQALKEEYQKICRFLRILNCVQNKIFLWGLATAQEIDLEFEAGGNLRFEEGSVNDSWFRSCCELVCTRQGEGMKATVTRVARIHNRLLRTRFEEKLESLVDTNEGQYKRNIDYLFYSGNDLLDIIVQGFKSPSDYAKQGGPCCIPLSYSLDTAETDRVRKLDEDLEDVHEIYWPSGKVLLCKVYFGKGKGDLRVPYYGEHLSPKEIWDLCPFKPPNICWAVYRTFEFDVKQRVWFLFDNAFILPEYLIEFEYSAEGFPEKNLKIEPTVQGMTKTLNAFYSEVIQKVEDLEDDEEVVPRRRLVKNVENFTSFFNGEFLGLMNCGLVNLNFFQSNEKITHLVLSCNQLENIKPVAFLPLLQLVEEP
jgi:Leucine-rich repeat (LRR) protein